MYTRKGGYGKEAALAELYQNRAVYRSSGDAYAQTNEWNPECNKIMSIISLLLITVFISAPKNR
jgi:hypothetical protein